MPHDPLEEFFASDGLTRRRFVGRAGSLGLLSTLIAACGGVKGTAQKATPTATAVNHPKVTIGNWTFSNWPLYIDKSVLKTFDKRYGGHVKYIEDINDNDEFYGKVRQQLQQGTPIGRDLVTLTDYMAAKWVRDGYVTPIDKANVPNMANLVDNLKSINYDPKRQYTLPWQSGATGIGYDISKTGGEITSLNALFDPKYKGKVTMLSEPYDSASLVMLLQGVNPSTATIKQILAAIDKIKQANDAGQFRRFTGNDYTTDLSKGNVWIAAAYSGDLVQLQSDNAHLRFAYPDEGSVIWTDNMMMPAHVQHPYAAETMMNFVYEPDVAAKIAAYVNYLSPVKGVKEILVKSNPKIARNPLIFPPESIRAKMHPYPALSPKDERTMKAAMAAVTGS